MTSINIGLSQMVFSVHLALGCTEEQKLFKISVQSRAELPQYNVVMSTTASIRFIAITLIYLHFMITTVCCSYHNNNNNSADDNNRTLSRGLHRTLIYKKDKVHCMVNARIHVILWCKCRTVSAKLLPDFGPIQPSYSAVTEILGVDEHNSYHTLLQLTTYLHRYNDNYE